MRFYYHEKNITVCTLLCLISLLVLFQSREALAEENVYRELIERGVATYEDGCRAISAYVGLPAGAMTFDEVVLALKKKEIVDKRWNYASDKTLTRAIVAYMVFKALDMKGGLTMRTANGIGRFSSFVCRKLGISDDFAIPDIGIGRRYAFLEFQFKGIIPQGNKRTFLTGHDLMAVMYRLEQYIKAKEAEKKKEEEKT
ncbi:MAG: hypothetical protein GY775_15035 [Candidatus Scalindua sp.]|nr:hypothetical protein [Candidatus Scalindua sp.]